MKGRFEVVRTAHEQWHARFVSSNGRIVWWTENYKRKVGAEKAISAIAHVFHGWIDDDSVTACSDTSAPSLPCERPSWTPRLEELQTQYNTERAERSVQSDA